MISLVNFKFNNTNVCAPQNLKIFKQNFRGCSGDVFVRSEESGDMKDDLYQQRDKTINMDEVSKKYLEKTSVLPLIMDRVMGSAGRYISGKEEVDKFSKRFLDGASSLATRISIGQDSEEYCECYKPELHFIEEVSPLCDDYYNRQLSKETFDSGIEKCVVVYVNDETPRPRNFVR